MIITISREYGSGGRFVGRRLSEELNIPFYDREIIKAAAKKSGLSSEYIESSDERRPSGIMYDVSIPIHGIGMPLSFQSPPSDQVFFAQADAIRDFASQGSCIIVGRCADNILRDVPGLLRVFIYSDMEDKKQRVTTYYGVEAKNAENEIERIDKIRKAYRKFYTGDSWNNATIYDLSVNTGLLGIEGALAAIKAAALAIK